MGLLTHFLPAAVMRILAWLFVVVLIAACCAAPVPGGQPRAVVLHGVSPAFSPAPPLRSSTWRSMGPSYSEQTSRAPGKFLMLSSSTAQRPSTSTIIIETTSVANSCTFHAGTATCFDCMHLLQDPDTFKNAFKLVLEGAVCSMPVASILLVLPGLLVSYHAVREVNAGHDDSSHNDFYSHSLGRLFLYEDPPRRLSQISLPFLFMTRVCLL